MLRVVRGNQAEPLARRLGEELATRPPADPFAAETVAVPSRGMERWLTHQLSGVLGATDGEGGVCANVDFAFPGVVLRRLLAAGCPLVDGTDPWEPERLTWTVLDVLPDLLDGEAFAPLRYHLHDVDGPVARRRWPLARRLAELFDRYALYRPELLAAWTAGDGDDDLPAAQRWQPQLWRALRAHLDEPDPSERFATAVVRFERGDVDASGLGERLAVFGVGQLPPAQLGLLEAAAGQLDVTVYLLSLSRALADERDAHLANPLLASLGDVATGFARQLAPTLAEAAVEDHSVDPRHGQGTALAVVQSDVLAGWGRGTSPSSDAAPVTRDPDDRSVQIHGCHGPTRQVEVLRDALLALLDDDPTLEPRDIAVLTPDIEAYAPLITAVFDEATRQDPGEATIHGDGDGRGDHPDAPPHLPVNLADRGLRTTNPVATALANVLDLVDSRAEATRVLDLLDSQPVRERFGLAADDLVTIRSWVADAGIRWGIDATHRAECGHPYDAAHTWRFGLDRLQLGVAMADDGERRVGDVVPFDDMEGDDVDRLDRLTAFCDTLFACLRELRAPRPVAEWGATLHRALDALVAHPDGADAWTRQVRETIDELVDTSRDTAGEPSPVELTLDELRTALGGRLERTPTKASYRTGAVTVSGLVPLRAVPHRVVCLLGMDDEAVPQHGAAHSFDLLGLDPRPGDPDPREEHRQLILDAAMSARDALVVTYTGRDLRTNEERQPAVPVAELRDVVADSAVPAGGGDPLDGVIHHHPLQAFDPANFDAAAPTSHDGRLLSGARQLLGEPEAPAAFVDEAVPADPVETVHLDDLVRFFRDPAAYFLIHRLGVRLDEDLETLEDRDPVNLSGLDRWAVGDALLRRRLQGREVDAWRETALRRGRVPAGAFGRYELTELERTVDDILAECEEEFTGQARELAVDVTVPVDGDGGSRRCRVIGTVEGMVGDTVLNVSFSKPRPHARLRQWLELLAVTACGACPRADALLACRDPKKPKEGASVRLRSLADVLDRRADEVAGGLVGAGEAEEDAAPGVETARRWLGELVGLYERGQREPLPLPPETAYAYAFRLSKGQGETEARKRARGSWEPREPEDRHGGPNDLERPANALVFGHLDDVDELLATDFPDMARAVWLPLLAQED